MPVLSSLFRKDPKSGKHFPALNKLFPCFGLRFGLRKAHQAELAEPPYAYQRTDRQSRNGINSYMELESGISLVLSRDEGQVQEVSHSKHASRIEIP